MKKDFYDVNDAGKTFLWAVLTPQILGTLIYMIFLWISTSTGETIDEILNNSINVYLLLMLTQISFALVFFIYNRKIDFIKACKFNKLSNENIFICIFIAIIALFGLTPISNISVELLQQAGLEFSTALPIGLESISDLIIAILLVAFVPAILEELIFRGMILQGLRKFGNWPAILISAGLFALIHASAVQLVYTFLFGVILALIVIKTGSIFASMICHFIANGLSLTLGYISASDDAVNLATTTPDFILAILIAFLTFMLIFSFVKKMKNNDKQQINYSLILKELKAKGITNISESDLINLKNSSFKQKNEEIISKFKDFKSEHKPNNSTIALKLGIAIGIAVWILNFSTYFI